MTGAGEAVRKAVPPSLLGVQAGAATLETSVEHPEAKQIYLMTSYTTP